jgi:hypothetical protein
MYGKYCVHSESHNKHVVFVLGQARSCEVSRLGQYKRRILSKKT